MSKYKNLEIFLLKVIDELLEDGDIYIYNKESKKVKLQAIEALKVFLLEREEYERMAKIIEVEKKINAI